MSQYLDIEVYKQLKRDLYKESYYEFFKDAYKAMYPDEIYSDNWHIKYLCDVLQREAERIIRGEEKGNDIIINMPFRAAKSLITTVMFPVWCWTVKQSMKFICVSYSGDLALNLAKKSRNLIDTDWFQQYFGDRVIFSDDGKSMGSQTIKGGGSRDSIGMGGTITGKGADIIVCLPEGEKILTDQGEIEIEKIVENKLNVKVASFNHKFKVVQFRKILNYQKNVGKKIIKITTENNKIIRCTEDHEVWTENRGYVKAIDLKNDDILLTR